MMEFEPRASLRAKLLLSLPDLPCFPGQLSSIALSQSLLSISNVVVYL